VFLESFSHAPPYRAVADQGQAILVERSVIASDSPQHSYHSSRNVTRIRGRREVRSGKIRGNSILI